MCFSVSCSAELTKLTDECHKELFVETIRWLPWRLWKQQKIRLSSSRHSFARWTETGSTNSPRKKGTNERTKRVKRTEIVVPTFHAGYHILTLLRGKIFCARKRGCLLSAAAVATAATFSERFTLRRRQRTRCSSRPPSHRLNRPNRKRAFFAKGALLNELCV